ncbi:MAG: DUF5615 family PIN-like protein [Acidobacteriota bacterium]|nr:DUF5615 family PIN-like protein [Acidobacteriota bacterium]
MLRLAIDEDFNNHIVRGVKLVRSDIDLLRAQDAGLRTRPDAEVLEWAARENRVLLTHDIETVPPQAYDRVRAGLPMPGVFIIEQSVSIGVAIEEIITLAECSAEGEWEGQVNFLPFK